METNKPKEACRKVEVILGVIESNEISSSVWPRNKQQASTIRRQLFQSQCNSDAIMALVDMHKTEFTDFIRSLQILPSPTCILATDAQLQELVKNCTLPGKFGIMHLDPTFNLGNVFVTPIVFPLITYIHKKNKCPPTLIGPVLIHHQMQFAMYSYFLNQIVSLKLEIRNVKAVGTDGEAALYLL